MILQRGRTRENYMKLPYNAIYNASHIMLHHLFLYTNPCIFLNGGGLDMMLILDGQRIALPFG